MKRKLAQGSIIIELLVIGTILIGVAATSYLAKRGQEAERAEALTICEVEGGRCCPSTYGCSGSSSGLSCGTGTKCCFGSCIPPAIPTPKPCNGTCIPDGEKDSCKTAGSGTCPLHKYCCATFKPDPTPKPTSPPTSVCSSTYAGKCVDNTLVCSPSTTYSADCASGKKCVPETASCSAQTSLPCPSGFSVNCSVDGTSVTINWNNLSGAASYVTRMNKTPYADWRGPGDLAKYTTSSQLTTNISPSVEYKYDVQGIVSGESYPYAGARCPFAAFKCTPQPCSGTCIPDGEKDSCQTQGTGTCPDYKYCCSTFKPTLTPTPTPYAGQRCENTYGGRCVSKTLVCSPTTTYSADCPSEKKCVPEAASCHVPTPTPLSCQSCGDTAPCSSGKSCDSQGSCILLSRNQGDCDCDENCATGFCYQKSSTDYCCNPGEIWEAGGCHPPYTPTPTLRPCDGTCIPDGEKDTCQTQGTGTCPDYKYCCGTFKPEPTATPTTYPGQRCENNYAGKCVDKDMICSPSTTFPADCSSGNKCVTETASCSNPPEPYCSQVMLVNCENGCIPDINGGTCSGDQPKGTYCSSEKILECRFNTLIPNNCVPDTEGGRCEYVVDGGEIGCFLRCVEQGKAINVCNSLCVSDKYYCTSEMERKCSNYHVPSTCVPDPLGGYCTLVNNGTLKHLEPCSANYECETGKCDEVYMSNSYGSWVELLCVNKRICIPGEKKLKSLWRPLDCTEVCSDTGEEWIITRDCNYDVTQHERFCKGDTVVYNKYHDGIQLPGDICDGGCMFGYCTASNRVSCTPGEYAYINGSCEGYSGCEDTGVKYNGNCLAQCSDTGMWKVLPGCGLISTISGPYNQERFDLLKTLSEFKIPLIPFRFMRFQSRFDYEGEYIGWGGYYQANEIPLIAVFPEGTSPGVYDHEIAHHIQHNRPDLARSYTNVVGCVQDEVNPEDYDFTNEEPISWYGYTNCGEAFSEAVRKIKNYPCEYKEDYPRQYYWVTDKLLAGKDGCPDIVVPTPIPIVTPTNTPTPPMYSMQEESDDELAEKISRRFSVVNSVIASYEMPYEGNLSIGSTISEVKAEMGNPSDEITRANLKIFKYDIETNESMPDVFIFNSSNKLIYFRFGERVLKDGYKKHEDWVSIYGVAEAQVGSFVAYNTIKYIYQSLGLTYVAEESSGNVIQVEVFTPISLDEYLDTWGSGLVKYKVKSPSEISPTPIPKSGDANKDEKVDSEDFTAWLDQYDFYIPDFNYDADFNEDGTVDGEDYIIWLSNYGT